MAQKIMVLRIRRMKNANVNQELQWLGNSLGLFGLRDKDSSCFRVFITLVKRGRSNDVMTSDEIADKLGLSRGTVVHHLSKLMGGGIVVHERGGYILCENSLEKLVKNLEHDIHTIFRELESVAREIDEKLD